MHPELLNLLPPERARELTRTYFIRLATMCVLALVVVIVASAALLTPSYLYVNQQVALSQARIMTVTTELGGSSGKETNQRLKALTDSATYLSRLATTTTATAALRAVLAVPRPGITLTGFTYTPPTQGANGKMGLTGMASTRETLRAYDSALSALPFVTSADLPISAYAKETSIPFTIALTGTLLP